MVGVQLCALFLFRLVVTETVGLPAGSQSGTRKAGRAMPIDPTHLDRSIGALVSLEPERGLAPTLQQIADAAMQLFAADGAGLMLVDAEGQLRWASASDQTAQSLEDGQERLAQGPCAVAFSQRLPAAIRDIRVESDWAEFAQVLIGEGVRAALSVPVELDGGVIGTLDIYAAAPRDWDPSEVAALQAYAGLWPACSAPSPPPRSRGGWPTSCRPLWSIVGSSSRPMASSWVARS